MCDNESHLDKCLKIGRSFVVQYLDEKIFARGKGNQYLTVATVNQKNYCSPRGEWKKERFLIAFQGYCPDIATTEYLPFVDFSKTIKMLINISALFTLSCQMIDDGKILHTIDFHLNFPDSSDIHRNKKFVALPELSIKARWHFKCEAVELLEVAINITFIRSYLITTKGCYLFLQEVSTNCFFLIHHHNTNFQGKRFILREGLWRVVNKLTSTKFDNLSQVFKNIHSMRLLVSENLVIQNIHDEMKTSFDFINVSDQMSTSESKEK
ncbi:CLUMA_CG019184, isoform A [Clunio marinus]|uniref:CLUMA_CG019184, isoform A n=1 Tax=Clunio marinus TaxID=568069 RepID=A0A1J1J0A6_9DIPT|nr:CLUMA_CG019184, isoform A [Clunio marinus]